MLSSLGEPARVAVASHYNASRHIFDAGCYEAEFVISDCDVIDSFAPSRPLARREGRLGGMRRRIGARLGISSDDDQRLIKVDKDYELFIFVASHLNKLVELPRFRNCRERSNKSACVLLKSWRSEIDEFRSLLPLLNNFDVVYTPILATIDYFQSFLKVQVRYLPYGVPALEWMPASLDAARPIDIYAMGRRPPALHEQLTPAMSLGLIYQFDAFDNLVGFVKDFQGQFLLKGQTLRRTKYFANFGVRSFPHIEADMAMQDDAVTSRCYEGAAAGTVMFGSEPTSSDYGEQFPWTDAIIPAPVRGCDYVEFLHELDHQPERMARVRRDNVVHSLRRHDFAYRYETILTDLKIAPHGRLAGRKARLAEAAHRFASA